MSKADRALVVCFALFAFTSLVMEPYFVFGVDYQRAHDPFAAGWWWYASNFDPIFLRRPMWLRVLCFLDFAVYGPFYLAAIYALVRRRAFIRPLALVVLSLVLATTTFYFVVEVVAEHDANLPVVFLVNLPYPIVAAAGLYRLRRKDPFEGAVDADRDLHAVA